MATKIQTPYNGEKILPWARQATHEINSLQPNAGPGIKIHKTAHGTTFSLDNGGIIHPDSLPPAIREYVSPSGVETSGFGTTYSTEKTEQNALALWRFGKLEHTDYGGDWDALSAIDICVRDASSSHAMGAPTLLYSNAVGLVSSILIGEPDNPTNPDYPYKPIVEMGLTPDSEMPEKPGKSKVVTKSIYHNSEDGLAIYHFEAPSGNDIVDTSTEDLSGLQLVVRGYSENGIGDSVPTVRYVNLTDLEDVDLMNLSTRLQEIEEGGTTTTRLQVWVANIQSDFIFVNNTPIPQESGSTISNGWNTLPAGSTAVYLNIFCNALPNGTLDLTQAARYGWDISNAPGVDVVGQRAIIHSELLAALEDDVFKVYRKGNVEIGLLIPDSGEVRNGFNQPGQKSLDYKNQGLMLHNFDNGVNQSRANLDKLFNGDWASNSWGFVVRDSHAGAGNDEVIYIDAQSLASMWYPDSQIPGGVTKSITYGTHGNPATPMGAYLYKFAQVVGGAYTYPDVGIVVEGDSRFSEWDLVIRCQDSSTQSGQPEVNYLNIGNFISALSGATVSGVSGVFPVVSDVVYDDSAHKFVKVTRNLTFENGLCIDVAAPVSADIVQLVKEMP